ncbi:MAG: hypothetical protein ATN35_02070 [Epulopiscium sp. Nele67-Bin004]|nr:MAG: hypothetical protein ATN35_02070 [Epulopiscium sp. Nele67-Bin004]
MKNLMANYGRQKRILDAKTLLLRDLREKRNSVDRHVGISSYDYTRMPNNKTSSVSSVESIAIKYLDLELNLEKQIRELEYDIAYVDSLLIELSPLHRELLISKYADQNTWDVVAHKSNLSVSRCQIHCKQALAFLESITTNFLTS